MSSRWHSPRDRVGGSTVALARSPHAVLEDTWQNLTDDERELLIVVSVFPGSFDHADLDGVLEHIVGTNGRSGLDRTLRRLLDFSLIEGHAAWCLAVTGDDVSAGLFSCALSDWCASHLYDLRAAERHLALVGRVDDAAALVASTAFAMHCDSGPRAAETLARLDSVVHSVRDPALIARLRFVGVMCGMATRAPDVADEQGRLGLRAAEESGSRLLRSHARVLRSWSAVFYERSLRAD